MDNTTDSSETGETNLDAVELSILKNHIDSDSNVKNKGYRLAPLVPVEYNMKSSYSPRLVGYKLKAVDYLLQTPFLGAMILQKIIEVNDIDSVEIFVRSLDKRIRPTLFPIVDDLQSAVGINDFSNRQLFKSDMISSTINIAEVINNDASTDKETTDTDSTGNNTASTTDIDKETDDENSNVTDTNILSSSPFRHWTISDYISRYQDSSMTPLQVAQTIVDILADPSKDNHAFISYNPDEILAQARASTERYSSSSTTGPLSSVDGIPIAIKDQINVRGYVTTCGKSLQALRCTVAPGAPLEETEDDACVAKIRAQGAIILGKLNMQEIGMGTTGQNLHHNTPHNPYASPPHACYPGGSSSGSACVVSCGLCPVSIGTDGGGSTRVPASLCGVHGFKPTFGRVEQCTVGTVSVSHISVLGVSIQDVALVYGVIASPCVGDETYTAGLYPSVMSSIPRPVYVPKFRSAGQAISLSGLRIGIYPEYFEDADPVVLKACERALDFLSSAGATVVQIAIPDLYMQRLAHLIIVSSEITTQDMEGDTLSYLSPDARGKLIFARMMTVPYYMAALRVRTYAIDVMKKLFKERDVHVIITPTVPTTAPAFLNDAKQGESNNTLTTNLMKFVTMANLTGMPAISVPVGYCRERGLPIGFHVMGRWWDEDVILRVAHAIEESCMANQWKKPVEFFDVFENKNPGDVVKSPDPAAVRKKINGVKFGLEPDSAQILFQ